MAFVTDPIGIAGEQAAAKLLKKKGLKVIEHNWRMGHLEVDLIAENRKEIVFVEVKARTTTFGNILPEEYVDDNKKKRMIAAANAYIKYNRCEKTPRFDIIGVLVDAETKKITYSNHLENIFAPGQRVVTSSTHSGLWKWFHRNKTIGSKRK